MILGELSDSTAAGHIEELLWHPLPYIRLDAATALEIPKDASSSAAFLRPYKDSPYASFEAAVKAADIWIATEKPRVVNVETVTLPNLWSPYEEGSSDADIHAGSVVKWHQFVRVWYEDP